MVTKRISTSIHFLNRGLLHKKVKEVDSCQINDWSNQHWHGPYDKNSQFKKGMWTFWTSTCNAGPPRSWFLGPECRWETPPTCRSRPGRSRHWGCWWPCRTSSRCCNQYHRWPPSSSWCLEISRQLRFCYLINFLYLRRRGQFQELLSPKQEWALVLPRSCLVLLSEPFNANNIN